MKRTYCRQPRRGDTLETMWGLVIVTEVRQHGQLIAVHVPNRGREVMERTPQGWWCRVPA